MSTSTKRLYNLLFVFGLLLVFVLVPMVRYTSSSDIPEERVFINLGLDLKGGVDLILAVDRKQYKGKVEQEQMEGAIEVMRRKIDPGGVKEIVVQQVGDERIAVQVPGAKDPAAVKEIIGRPDALKWIDTGSQFVKPRTTVNFIDDVSQLKEGELVAGQDAITTEEAGTSGGTPVTPEGTVETAVSEEAQPADSSEISTGGAAGTEFTPVDVTEGGVVQGTASEGEEAAPEDSGYTDEFKAALGEEVDNKEDGGATEGEGEVINVITDPASDRNQVVITGADLELVQTTFYNNQPVISFRITRDAAGKFAKHTGSNIGKYMAIALNNEIISCPVIKSRIGRSGQIDGFSTDEAKQLELLLNAGRIPVPLEVVQERTVSPTLGAESIRVSLKAGVVGLCLVLAFMLIYYRLPGLLADIALLMYGVIFMGTMVMLNVTLTLPGIAGVILSLGMAVDANIIIFERLKDEFSTGKTMATAVKDAFKRAWAAILDGNVTTLITGFILWSIGTGPIKGFAITLCLGILLSMFTAIYVTRNLLEIVVSLPAVKKSWLSCGLGRI